MLRALAPGSLAPCSSLTHPHPRQAGTSTPRGVLSVPHGQGQAWHGELSWGGRSPQLLKSVFSPEGGAQEMRDPAVCQALDRVHSLIKTEISHFDKGNVHRGMWKMCLHSLKVNDRMYTCAHPRPQVKEKNTTHEREICVHLHHALPSPSPENHHPNFYSSLCFS